MHVNLKKLNFEQSKQKGNIIGDLTEKKANLKNIKQAKIADAQSKTCTVL
jgi:hypothetical protein